MYVILVAFEISCKLLWIVKVTWYIYIRNQYISEINKQQTLVLSLNYLIEDLSTIIGIKVRKYTGICEVDQKLWHIHVWLLN